MISEWNFLWRTGKLFGNYNVVTIYTLSSLPLTDVSNSYGLFWVYKLLQITLIHDFDQALFSVFGHLNIFYPFRCVNLTTETREHIRTRWKIDYRNLFTRRDPFHLDKEKGRNKFAKSSSLSSRCSSQRAKKKSSSSPSTLNGLC
jgi:hypothetical protein